MKIELRALVMALRVLKEIHKGECKGMDGRTYCDMLCSIALLEHSIETSGIIAEVTA